MFQLQWQLFHQLPVSPACEPGGCKESKQTFRHIGFLLLEANLWRRLPWSKFFSSNRGNGLQCLLRSYWLLAESVQVGPVAITVLCASEWLLATSPSDFLGESNDNDKRVAGIAGKTNNCALSQVAAAERWFWVFCPWWLLALSFFPRWGSGIVCLPF